MDFEGRPAQLKRNGTLMWKQNIDFRLLSLTFYINETDPGSESSVDAIFSHAIVLSRIRS